VTWVDAADAASADGTVVSLSSGGRLVAVVRSEGGWHALDAWCTHAECPLTDGWVEDGGLRCACHGALFDLASGEPREGPALEAVRVYPTRNGGNGRIAVELPD
jgi:nitrite reductase/ring-hydroxylating ferredoxin subunit